MLVKMYDRNKGRKYYTNNLDMKMKDTKYLFINFKSALNDNSSD